MTRLVEIEGIGETYSGKLQAAAIESQEQLLEAGATAAGRKALAEKTGIGGGLILNWVNRADLARVKGIGEEYADLLECSGVDTVPELAQRNVENLLATMTEVNAEKNCVRKLPTQEQVTAWCEQAKKLSRVVTY